MCVCVCDVGGRSTYEVEENIYRRFYIIITNIYIHTHTYITYNKIYRYIHTYTHTNMSALAKRESKDKAENLMNSMDFRTIEQMDPSVSDGFAVIYDREVPFELRLQESNDGPQEVGTLEAIKVKILILGEDGNPNSLRIELSSENDLFFHYMHLIDESGFRMVQEGQKLMVDFTDYSNVLIRMLNSCIKEPHSHLAVFVMQRDGQARLDFIQNMQYKFVDLLSCNFHRSPDELVRQQITYRYNSLKSRLALMQARLQDVNALVKIKNPSLLKQLTTSPPRLGNGSRR